MSCCRKSPQVSILHTNDCQPVTPVNPLPVTVVDAPESQCCCTVTEATCTSVEVTDPGTSIASANPQRSTLYVFNASETHTVHLCPGGGVASSYVLPPQASILLTRETGATLGVSATPQYLSGPVVPVILHMVTTTCGLNGGGGGGGIGID